MKKIIFSFTLISFLLSGISNLAAQETVKLVKSPRQMSLEAGYRNVFSIIDRSNVLNGNNVSHGFGFLFDYGWKVSGLDGSKPAIYLTVPIGYTWMFASDASSKNMTMLNYGWTVRHELSKNKKITPFVGYGLLLNTLKMKDLPGGTMGHQTQFDLGLNFNTNSRFVYFAKIQYSYTSYPRLNDDKRIHFQFADLRIGARF